MGQIFDLVALFNQRIDQICALPLSGGNLQLQPGAPFGPLFRLGSIGCERRTIFQLNPGLLYLFSQFIVLLLKTGKISVWSHI
jgi:hypothetical protein